MGKSSYVGGHGILHGLPLPLRLTLMRLTSGVRPELLDNAVASKLLSILATVDAGLAGVDGIEKRHEERGVSKDGRGLLDAACGVL